MRDLCNDLQNKNHRVYFDDYFTSLPLMEDLRKKKKIACGTVNINRKYLPTILCDRNVSRGQYDVHTSNSNVVAMKWKDNRSKFPPT